MMRQYPTLGEAQDALEFVDANMAALAQADGYLVVDGQIVPSDNPTSSGTATWAEIIETPGGFGFPDPAAHPVWGSLLMAGVPEGELITYVPPEVTDQLLDEDQDNG